MEERRKKPIVQLPEPERRTSGIAPKGSREPLEEEPRITASELDLELAEFLRDVGPSFPAEETATGKADNPILPNETPTVRIRYVDGVADMKARIRKALAFSPEEEFDQQRFADSIMTVGSITHERESANMYHQIVDADGNSFRLYLEPKDKLEDCIDKKRRVVLELDGQLGYLFPVVPESRNKMK